AIAAQPEANNPARAAPAYELPGATPHQRHDDSLLNSLVLVTRLLGRPCPAPQLPSGLPLVDQRLTPSLLGRAAGRAQCSARIVRRALGNWSRSIMPAILFLKNQRACVLIQERGDHYLVDYPEAAEPVEVPRTELEAEYSG